MESTHLLAKFPLATKKKFWKKMIEKFIVFFFLSIPLAFVTWVLVSMSNALHDLTLTTSIIIGVVAWALFFTLFSVIYGFYVTYYIKTYYYEHDEDFLTIRKGVFAPTEIHVQYQKIQDVYVDQDILDRILGLYDVHVASATFTSGIEAHIDGLEKQNADGLKKLLLDAVRDPRSMKGKGDEKAETSHSEHATTAKVNSVDVSELKHFTREKYPLSFEWYVGELLKVLSSSFVTILILTFYAWANITDSKRGDFAANGFYWFVGVAFGIFAIQFLFTLGRMVLWTRHYRYEFGEEYIYFKVGVLSVSETSMPYSSIQNVSINQTLIDKIVGVADVVIENASQMTSDQQLKAVFAKRTASRTTTGVTIEGLYLSEARELSDSIKKVIASRRDGLTRGI